MNTMPCGISAFIICKDEVTILGPCLESLSSCSEIIIVDSGSTDGTLDLIESYRAAGYPIRLFQRDWPGYALQKQFALEQCTGQWCLSIDADERLDEALQDELQNLVAAPDTVAAWRLDFRLSLYGYGYVPESVRFGAAIRLTRNGRAHFGTDALVHESMHVDGEIRTATRGKILHARSLPIDEQIMKERVYASLKAQQLFNKGKRPRLFRLVFNPFVYFAKTYFAKRFILCSWAGFIHSVTAAIYSFMTEAKLWQLHAQAEGRGTLTPASPPSPPAASAPDKSRASPPE